MKKVGIGLSVVIALVVLVGIVILGRQHQANLLASQEESHAALVADRPSSASSSKSSESSAESASDKPARKPQTIKYVALGDELANGYYTTKEQNAYQYLIAKQLKAEGDTVTMDGFWAPGDTVGQMQDRVAEIKAMAPTLITIQLGTNDQDTAGPNNVPAATFKTNLTNLVTSLQKEVPAADLVLFTVWKGQKDYDDAVKAVAKTAQLPVIDLAPIAKDKANIAAKTDTSWAGSGFGDGFYPNDKGNKAIATAATKVIDDMLAKKK